MPGLYKLEYFTFAILLFAKETLQSGSPLRRGVQDKSSIFRSVGNFIAGQKTKLLQVLYMSTLHMDRSTSTPVWHANHVQTLVRRWAPLVFLAPGEKFFPSDVPEFLNHVIAIPERDVGSNVYEDKLPQAREELPDDLPKGRPSESWYLTTRDSVDNLMKNSSSFIYGRNPEKFSVPVYALIEICQPRDSRTKRNPNVEDEEGKDFHPHFHVTYWMFYPFSQGKSLCTFDMGRFGAWPIPKLNNYCLGNIKEFGNHVGDWEHMSLYFEGSNSPSKMYVSTHDVGAFYRYSEEKDRFEFEKREIRKGILQRPAFPPTMKLSKPGNHPVLFAAKGSHGLWTAPGRHRFVRLPRLHDDSGFGIPWLTWKNVHMLKAHSHTERNWLRYRGRWGNQKSRCHPVSKLGINICELTDGPTGIPVKKVNFNCSAEWKRPPVLQN